MKKMILVIFTMMTITNNFADVAGMIKAENNLKQCISDYIAVDSISSDVDRANRVILSHCDMHLTILLGEHRADVRRLSRIIKEARTEAMAKEADKENSKERAERLLKELKKLL